jgi:zinc protease
MNVKKRYQKNGEKVMNSEEQYRIVPKKYTLSNGVKISTLKRTHLPIFVLRVYFPAGIFYETKENNGVSSLALKMLLEGTKRWSHTEIVHQLERAGIDYTCSNTSISFTCMKEVQPAMMNILCEMLTAWTAPLNRFEKLREEILHKLSIYFEDADNLLFDGFRARLYQGTQGELRIGGSLTSLQTLSREDVYHYMKKHFTANNLSIHVVGDFDESAFLQNLEQGLSSLPQGEFHELNLKNFRFRKQIGNYFVFKERNKCSVLLGHAGVRKWSRDFLKLRCMDLIFGMSGNLMNRLAARLREELGLCYEVFGDISTSASRIPGLFQLYIGTAPENLEYAVAEMKQTLQEFLDEGPTWDELEDAKLYLKGSLAFQMESNASLANLILERERYGLDEDFLQRELAGLDRIKIDDILKVARARLHPDRLVSFVVGKQGLNGSKELKWNREW